MRRVFLLSPARTDGKRAGLLLNDSAKFDLALRLRTTEGAPLGDTFSFLSGLYFRGKLAYAKQFSNAPDSAFGAYSITSSMGLMPVNRLITIGHLRNFASVGIDLSEARYTEPLRASVMELKGATDDCDCNVVLLGSVATAKYVDILLEAFGDRLLFPKEFIGRGDMSRGGLLLRAVRAGEELEYVRVSDVAERTGKRPPKLPPVPKNSAVAVRTSKQPKV
ncbi:MAG: hypothetical protein U0136_15900 [Bdellovibrionota bacterium]